MELIMTLPEINNIIKEYQEQIKEDEIVLNKLEGKYESLLEELKLKYKIDSIEEAEKELSNLDVEASLLEEDIETSMNSLQDKYPLKRN